jgi:hypothetical protein
VTREAQRRTVHDSVPRGARHSGTQQTAVYRCVTQQGWGAYLAGAERRDRPWERAARRWRAAGGVGGAAGAAGRDLRRAGGADSVVRRGR